MTRDDLIAHHVEALVGLGWRWEGRGLIPRWDTKLVTALNDQQLSQEAIKVCAVGAAATVLGCIDCFKEPLAMLAEFGKVNRQAVDCLL